MTNDVTDSDTQLTPEIRLEAATWAEMFDSTQALNDDDMERFETWLARDPRHAAAFDACVALERDLHRLADNELSRQLIHDAEQSEPQRLTHARSWRRLPLRALAASVVAAMVIAGGSVLWLFDTDRAAPTQFDNLALVTERGERLEHALSDGSSVHLNTASRIAVAFSQDERRVKLISGEAYFEVAHDAQRPFIVEAAGHDVRAVGTAFNVYLRPDQRAVVTVAEGRVSVARHAGLGQGGVAQAAVLNVGDQLELDAHGVAAIASATNITHVTSWIDGRITFDEMALEDVIAEFERYGDVRVTFESTDVRAVRISGVFDPLDVNTFFAALEHIDGVNVHQRAGGHVLSSSER